MPNALEQPMMQQPMQAGIQAPNAMQEKYQQLLQYLQVMEWLKKMKAGNIQLSNQHPTGRAVNNLRANQEAAYRVAGGD